MSVQKIVNICRRCRSSYSRTKFSTFAKTKENEHDQDKINSWQIHSYGGFEDLQLTKSRVPVIKDPNGVLVKVFASSVNPIDIAMTKGYGSVLLNAVRKGKACTCESLLEFPLTLGRDFSGVVIGKGNSVKDAFQIGDEVWGVVPPYEQGAHAEQVIVSEANLCKKPANLNFTEAGSMLYAAVTAWSALRITGDLWITPARNKIVLILGGSGGVGSASVQLLRSWGAHVVATCSTDAVPLVESLGATEVIDYSETSAFEKIGSQKYDIILDCAGIGQDQGAKYCKYLKDHNISKFITLKSPMLKNFDELGLIGGTIKNAGDLLLVNITNGLFMKSSSIRWGFFLPIKSAIQEITELVKNKKLVPCIHKTFPFEDLPEAYKFVDGGHLRGKVVINVVGS